jgi:hypothetical protein
MKHTHICINPFHLSLAKNIKKMRVCMLWMELVRKMTERNVLKFKFIQNKLLLAANESVIY